MIAAETFALRSPSVGVPLLGVLGGIALVIVGCRENIRSIALAAAYSCAFTLTWNGWFLGPVRPGDLLILLTVLLILLADPDQGFRTPPWWAKQLAVAVILVGLLTVYFPTDPVYLANRLVLDAGGKPTTDTHGNLGVAFKFVIAVFATPMAFIGATRIDKRAARRLGVAFGAGAALSGWAATADHFGADVARIVTGVSNVASRQGGFAAHPNFLAAGTVLAIPFAFWLLCSDDRRERLIGVVAMPGLIGGVYSSGSRGGAVCAIGVLGLCVVLFPKTRRYWPTIALAGAVLAGLLAGLVPSIGHTILRVTRLVGDPTTSGSDTVRRLVGEQGMRDFKHSPLHGIGLQASFDASQVYLQELASGGLLLFTAMQVYLGGAIVTAWRYVRRDDMAAAALGSLVAILALNFFEADLTDRFYYVPAAILIAMAHALDREVECADEAGDSRADAPPTPAKARSSAVRRSS